MTLVDGDRPAQKFETRHEAAEWFRDQLANKNTKDAAELGGPTTATLAQALHPYAHRYSVTKGGGDSEPTLGDAALLALWQGDAVGARELARRSMDLSRAIRADETEVYAGLCLGHAELALGRTAGARQAYTQALAGAQRSNSPAAIDARAGLVRVAMAEADIAVALTALQPLLDHAQAAGTLRGTDDPRLIELTAHLALARVGDPLAAEWLDRAHTALMTQADAITDATLRQGFLQHIPHHRAIRAAWEDRTRRSVPRA